MNTIEVSFLLNPCEEAIVEVLMAELGNIGYNGFTYEENGFKAYIPENEYDEKALVHLEMLNYYADKHHITFTTTTLPDRDWNKTWEENFQPIIVDNRIQVRAGFHAPLPEVEYEIIIEPKMSFGTGHHATTALMLRTILEHAADFRGKRVLDMGCGTGILAIMASKAGAREVVGIDIDEWAYNNAMENLKNNAIDNASIKIGDASLLAGEAPFDIILANINRNILIQDMDHYIARLVPGGMLVMSGYYEQDLPLIREKAEQAGMTFEEQREEKQWVAAVFTN